MTTQARELAKLVSNAGDLNFIDDITLGSDGALLNFGADSDVVITHVADTGLLLNSTRQLQFGDSGTFIRQEADGVLDLTSDTEIELNATTLDINANVDISGTLAVAGNLDFGDAVLSNVGAVQLDSITGDGDTNTSITFSGSDVITIATGGSGRLTIGDGALSPVTDNQIDLGTSSLEFKDAFFDGTVTSDAFAGPLTGNVTGNVSGTAATVTGASQSAITSVGTLTGLNVSGGGSFDGDLQVGDYSATPELTLAASGNAASKINFYDSNATEGVYISSSGATYGGQLNFGARWDNDNNRVTIKMLKTGTPVQFGIGTESPARPLHVFAAGSDAGVIRIENTGSGNHVAGIELLSGHGNWGIYNSDTVGDALEFRDDSASATRMIITSTGKVGIGTTSPQKILHTASDGIRIDRGGGGSYWDIGPDATNDFKFVPNGSEVARITTDGKVGIGTTSPSCALEVVDAAAGQPGTAFKVYSAQNSAATDGLVFIHSDQSLAPFTALNVRQDGTGDILNLLAGTTEVMSVTDDGDVDFGGTDQASTYLTVGRVSGNAGQGNGHIQLKSSGASYMDWWDAGAGNTIRLHTHSVNLRMVDQPNGDPCIQFEAAGNIDIDGSYLTGGFDYAEYFESTDGSAIPVGTSVVLVNEKVRAATSGEQPLGVVRPGSDGTSVVGGSAGNRWVGKYLKDDYDAYLYDTVDFWVFEINGEDKQCWSDRVPDGWTVPANKKVTAMPRKRLNPDFVENLDSDGNQIYANRESRDEWNCIGLLGQVPITKGQVTNSNWTKLKDRSASVELWFIK